MDEKKFYPSINCKYCEHSCRYNSKKIDSQFQCCADFFPKEVRMELDEASKKSNSLPEDQVYARLAVLLVPTMNAESENPKRRNDGSYIVILSDKLTPKLKEHLTRMKKEQEKKHERQVRFVRFLVVSIIICVVIWLIKK